MAKDWTLESKFVKLPTLSWLVASEVVIKTTSRTANDNSMFNNYSHVSVFQTPKHLTKYKSTAHLKSN